MHELREVLFWLSLIGLPSIFAIVVWCVRLCLSYAKQLDVLVKAQQAQLLEQYHKYMKRDYIAEEELEDWENQYQAYHLLGKNGVLDSRRENLLKLPSVPE